MAIPIAPDILEALEAGVETLRESRAPVKWVRPEGMHLTLKFLGETQDIRVPPLVRAMGSLCSRFEPFPMSVCGIGAYPNMRRPRVIWAGVEERSGTLEKLQGGVEEICGQLGWPREKRSFSPHVTVGRIKGRINLGRLAQAMGKLDENPWGTQSVNSVVLYSSELKPGGAEYKKLHLFPLGKGEA